MTILKQSEQELSLVANSHQVNLEWVAVRDGDVHWKVHPEFKNQLFSQKHFAFSEWEKTGSLEIIKTGPHRTVYKVQLEDENVYLKHYRTPDWKSKFQNLVRPSKAMLEWNVEKRMTAFGIPTIETVAIGQKIRNGQVSDNFLVSKEIPETETLQEFVERWPKHYSPQMQIELRKRLAKQLGHLIGKMHCGYFDHHDLHCGNVLVRLDPGLGVRLWIIDLHAIRCKKQLNKNWMLSNLSLFNNYFARMISQTDRRRFYKSYWRTIQSHDTNSHKVIGSISENQRIQTIENYCNEGLQKRYQKDDRKWNRPHRKLILSDSKDLSYRALSCLGKDWISSIVKQPEKLLDKNTTCFRLRNEPGFQESIISLPINGENKKFLLKYSRVTGDDREKQSGDVLLKQAWKNGQRLFRRSVDSVQPQLWIEQRTNKETESWLLFDYDKEMIPLSVFMGDSFASMTPVEQVCWREKYLKQLTKNMRWMVTCGFLHQSLSAKNLLVHSQPNICKLQFTQHESLVQVNKVTYQEEIRQLAQFQLNIQQTLKVSLSLQFRFLKSYLAGKDKTKVRLYWNNIRTEILDQTKAK